MKFYVYLHGFGSSPGSAKAQYLNGRFASLSLPLHLPDLHQNDFYTLTLSRQIQQVASLLPWTAIRHGVTFNQKSGRPFKHSVS